MLTAMPRKALQRLLPDPSRFAGHRSLRLLRGRLHDPNLWYLTRHSVSTAVFIGLFIALIPMPLQMLTAALLALWWRANLAISVALVWVTNPLTMPPVYYFAYRLGAALLQRPVQPLEFEPSLTWLIERLAYIWDPLLLGSLVLGLALGAGGAILVRICWRVSVARRWRQRRHRRRDRGDQS